MRLIQVGSLRPGDILNTPIRNANGSLLLQANKKITETYISRLADLHISAVYVVDDLFDDVHVEPTLDDDQKAKILGLMQDAFTSVKRGGKLPYDAMYSASGTVYDNVQTRQSPVNLINLFATNDAKGLHALNVATMVAAMSVESGWTRNMAADYILAAMLHDLMLEDMMAAETSKHVEDIFRYLKSQSNIPPRTYMACYMHHDYYDGTKGHQRVTGKDINDGARMIAVADYYDNMVNGYCRNAQTKPHHTLEMLNTMRGTAFDPDVVDIFNNTVAIYPTGATVLLNSGHRAIVTRQNTRMPARPVVRLLMKNREECLEFNLLTSRTLFIDKVEL